MSRTSKLIIALMVLAMFGAWMAPKQTPRQAEQRAAEANAKAEQEAANDAARAKRREADRIEYASIATAKKAVLERLKDPESAKFGKVVYRSSGAVCGYVNAKNSFGGYSGDTAFIAMLGRVWMESDANDFGDTWNKHCAS